MQGMIEGRRLKRSKMIWIDGIKEVTNMNKQEQSIMARNKPY